MVPLRFAFRAIGYAWAAPYSLIGLALGLVAVLLGARMRTHSGALEIGGGRLGHWASRLRSPFCFSAITLGHVVLGTDHATLAAVRAHEQVHVRQYERWGPFFGPAYLLSSLVQLLRGRRPYLDNRFEREAYTKASIPERAAPCCSTSRPGHYEEITMDTPPAGLYARFARVLARVLKFCAAAIAVHGAALGLTVAARALFPGASLGSGSELVGTVWFFVMAVPALILTGPITPLLWKLGLMNAPGWFAWPKPLGVALAYAVWVVVFLGLATAVQRWLVTGHARPPPRSRKLRRR